MAGSAPLPDPHRHDTGVPVDAGAERRTLMVIVVTLAMMLAEVGAGILFGSMALLADGWHMGSHAAALGITVFAYAFARRFHGDPRYSFGTGKVGVLGGYTSAVVLAVIAVGMVWASIERLLSPRAIAFDEALFVAVLGLLVNLLSAWLLVGSPAGHDGHDHDHEPAAAPPGGHGHGLAEGAAVRRRGGAAVRDHSLRAAYLHVLADALTSLLAIVALTAGKLLGWGFLDPLMGLVGGALILRWSWGLLRDSASILLDRSVGGGVEALVRGRLQGIGALTGRDLHLWRLSPHHLGVIVSVETATPCTCDELRALLRAVPGITHVTIEIRQRAADG